VTTHDTLNHLLTPGAFGNKVELYVEKALDGPIIGDTVIGELIPGNIRNAFLPDSGFLHILNR